MRTQIVAHTRFTPQLLLAPASSVFINARSPILVAIFFVQDRESLARYLSTV
jgi:hypothetical protein